MRNILPGARRCRAARTRARAQQICHSLQPTHLIIPNSKCETQRSEISPLATSPRVGASVSAPLRQRVTRSNTVSSSHLPQRSRRFGEH
jgi:hypothetical protein